MGQFLRPDSNVTQTNFTGGYTAIDETTPNDSDFAYASLSGGTCTLEVGLSNPASTPGSAATTIQYRLAKCSTSGSIGGSGSSATGTMSLYQGATLIASDVARTIGSSSWTTFIWTPNTAAVSDWTNVRLRFVVNTAATKSIAISWAEVETPFGDLLATFAATEARDTLAASGSVFAYIFGALAVSEEPDTFAAGAPIPVNLYGTPNVCMRCGLKRRVRELRKEWTGVRVCPECWDPKPAEMKPPKIRPEGLPKPNSYPEPPPVYGRIEPDML